MDLLEPAQGVAAGLDDVLVAGLPALELGPLAGPLLAIDLHHLAREVELLALDFHHLANRVERLVLEVDHHVEEHDRVVGVGDADEGPCPVGETSMR